MPRLQRVISSRADQPYHGSEFVGGKSVVTGKLAPLEPDFGRGTSALHMHVRRFRQIMADKTEPKALSPKHGRHSAVITVNREREVKHSNARNTQMPGDTPR
jgi:hypothetical protein